MPEATIEGRLLKWGNSYGIRISKKEVERLGLQPGQAVVARLEEPPGGIDLSHVRFVVDPSGEGKSFQQIRQEHYHEKGRRFEANHRRRAEEPDEDR